MKDFNKGVTTQPQIGYDKPQGGTISTTFGGTVNIPEQTLPIEFEIKSNLKHPDEGIHIVQYPGPINLMDYLVHNNTELPIPAYYGCALLENVTLTENGTQFPAVGTKKWLTQSPYSFIPEDKQTYVILQANTLAYQGGMLAPDYMYTFQGDKIGTMCIVFFVPKSADDLYIILNDTKYNYKDQNLPFTVSLVAQVKFGSATIKKTNCYVVYIDITSYLKSSNNFTLGCGMDTADGVYVQGQKMLNLSIKSGADIENLLKTDVLELTVNNPNYLDFLEEPEAIPEE